MEKRQFWPDIGCRVAVREWQRKWGRDRLQAGNMVDIGGNREELVGEVAAIIVEWGTVT